MGLQGITIIGGYHDFGTVITCYSYRKPEFENCIFSHNVATSWGGVLHSLEGKPSFKNCQFTNNSAVHGGAIALSSRSTISLESCVFSDNIAQDGGALYCENADTTAITNCTFSQNKAVLGANICLVNNTVGWRLFSNTIMAFGSGAEAVHWDGQGSLVLACVDIFGNEGGDWVGALSGMDLANGNLHLDPQFCGEANPLVPFFVAATSPCAPANNPGCGLIGALPVGCSVTSGGLELPLVSDFQLKGCYPNPFNPTTTLSFELKVASEATLVIFDATGNLVRSLAYGFFPAGQNNSIWHGLDDHGRPVGSGIYFARLSIGRHSEVQKMVLLR